jgi:hypothetical protein
MSYAQAKRKENRRWSGGCWDSGFWRFHKLDGSNYAMVVAVNNGQRVHALHAFGPHPLVC